MIPLPGTLMRPASASLQGQRACHLENNNLEEHRGLAVLHTQSASHTQFYVCLAGGKSPQVAFFHAGGK